MGDIISTLRSSRYYGGMVLNKISYIPNYVFDNKSLPSLNFNNMHAYRFRLESEKFCENSDIPFSFSRSKIRHFVSGYSFRILSLSNLFHCDEMIYKIKLNIIKRKIH